MPLACLQRLILSARVCAVSFRSQIPTQIEGSPIASLDAYVASLCTKADEKVSYTFLLRCSPRWIWFRVGKTLAHPYIIRTGKQAKHTHALTHSRTYVCTQFIEVLPVLRSKLDKAKSTGGEWKCYIHVSCCTVLVYCTHSPLSLRTPSHEHNPTRSY
jgi:hypothetical protein